MLLALLLPSGLTLPHTGPSTLAEYAPVPGQGKGSSNLAQLGAAQSDGEPASDAAGGGLAKAPGTPTQPLAAVGPAAIIKKAATKRCVGDPPRQSEDPLSPPCVAFFEGDNGGATTKGVTKDEVIVVVGTGSTSDPITDCAEPAVANESAELTGCRAYMRYFNERYQTYGRTVHVFAVPHDSPTADVEDKFRPFMVADGGIPVAYAARKSMGVGVHGQPRSVYQSSAPYLMSLWPDLDDQTAMTATYVCLKLAGRPARFTTDPAIAGAPRRFALWQNNNAAHADELRQAIKASCGLDITERDDSPTDPTQAARLRTLGITTVIAQMSNVPMVEATNTAASQGWFPEWVVPGDVILGGIDTNGNARAVNQAEFAQAIGISFDIRRDALIDQPWYRAYHSGCPACSDPRGVAASNAGAARLPTMYGYLSMVFYAIQAAGPRLTPQAIDKGLHAIPPQASIDPYRPASYFSPGNFSFMKDAMSLWWDPSGQAPGSAATGCYRLPNDGRRSRAGEWSAGDDDARGPGPCQGDTVQT